LTNRIRQIEDAEWPIIVPVEDRLEIVHGPAKIERGWCVMVECPSWRDTNEVIEFVKRETKQDWIAPIPSRFPTVGAQDFTQGNPHINGKGYWVWLFVRVEQK